MIQNLISKSSKFLPNYIIKTNLLQSKIFYKNLTYKFNLVKLSQFNFSDKKGKDNANKDKSNVQVVENQKESKKNHKQNQATPKEDKNDKPNQKNNKEKIVLNESKSPDSLKKEMEINPEILIKYENEVEKSTSLSPEDKKNLLKISNIFKEKDPEFAEAQFNNLFFNTSNNILGEFPPEDESIKDYESTKIVHVYEKEFGVTSENEKNYLDKITKDYLKDYEIDAKEAEFLRGKRADILSYSLFERFRDLKTTEDLQEYLSSFTEFKNFEYVQERFDNLVQYAREYRDLKNPSFIQIRSMDKLLKNDQKIIPRERDVDTRQNANSEDYLKMQPRMKIDYSYNYEHYKEFYQKFDKYSKEDQIKQIEKMKLIKYIKTNPDKYDVKDRWISKYYNVPMEKLPDYDVDISDYKPPITKKSRRRFEKSKLTDITNYEAWRVFDRDPEYFSISHKNIKVELIPKNLVDVIFFYI